MKHNFRTLLPAVLLLTVLGGPALAQTKVATVDLDKLFNNYWKTKQAQAAIQAHRDQLDKDDKSMRDDLQKATSEYAQLLTQADDPAISADERARRQQAAAQKKQQLADRSAAINEYEQTAQANLNDQTQHMGDKIWADIHARVDAAAKADGYTVVFNTAAQKISLGNAQLTIPSPVVYSIGQVDLTDEVLKQLNAGAPIDLTTTNAAPVNLSVPPPLNTNGL